MAKFVISKEIVLKQYGKVEKISDLVSYSSKTNPIVSKILEENSDSMFSIHMECELKNVSDKKRVMFLAQGLNEMSLKGLVEQGIRWFVIDNEIDLEVFVDFLKNCDEKINILLRAKLRENTLRTEKYFVFGMDSEIVNKKIVELRKNKNIGLLGVHFHRKTQNMAEWNLVRDFESIIDKEILGMLDVVCIGGGMPSEYANTNVNVIDGIWKKIE